MYGRRRSYARRYRRPFYRPRRAYGRSRRVQMNDSETRTMSFTQNMDVPLTVGAGVQGIASSLSFINILSGGLTTGSGDPVVNASSGRIYFAGMMYDRFRVKTCSVQVRPKIMPAATGVPNYTFYLAWDRYDSDLSTTEMAGNPRVVTDDPSAKMIIWSPGGSASTLSHYVYSLPKDRYQYASIDHRGATSWDIDRPIGSPAFLPTLRYVIDLGNDQPAPLTVRLIFQFRYTLEFMGACSIGTGQDHGPLAMSLGVGFQPTAAPSQEHPDDVAEVALRMRALGRPLPSQLSPMMPPAPRIG